MAYTIMCTINFVHIIPMGTPGGGVYLGSFSFEKLIQ